MFNIRILIISVFVVAVVGIIAYLLNKKSEANANNSEGKEVKAGEKGCSLVFYIFIGLLLLFFAIGFYMYKTVE